MRYSLAGFNLKIGELKSVILQKKIKIRLRQSLVVCIPLTLIQPLVMCIFRECSVWDESNTRLFLNGRGPFLLVFFCLVFLRKKHIRVIFKSLRRIIIS